MCKRLIVLLMVVGALGCVQSMAFGQTQPEQRIAQPIVLNGQQAQGVLVVLQNGTIQSYTCASPQPYTTPDGASSGWACFEATSGQWLLHALPPQPEAANPPSAAPVPAVPAPQATVVYGAPLPTYAPAVVPAYGYYPYSYYPAYYPYGYYPYSYSPYFVGPRYGVGFGFGYRGPVFAPRAVGGVSVVRAGGRVGGGRR
jgi:hypothetical protein